MGYPVQITSKISVLQLETPYAVTKLENKTNHVCSEALFMREKLKGRISRSINLECFQQIVSRGQLYFVARMKVIRYNLSVDYCG